VRSQDVVGALDQQTSQIRVTSLGDTELRIAFTGLAAFRSQTKVATDVSTASESTLISECEDKRIVAAIGNGAAFRKGRDFAAWLGLVPRHYSTGGNPCSHAADDTLSEVIRPCRQYCVVGSYLFGDESTHSFAFCSPILGCMPITFPPGFFDIPCSECHYPIPPSELILLDMYRVRCPKCLAEFVPEQKGKSVDLSKF